MEPENDHNRYAVDTYQSNYPSFFYKFLSQHGQIEAECIGRKKGQIGKSVTYENVIVMIDLPCFE